MLLIDKHEMGFKHNRPVQEFSDNGNFALDIKLRELCIGLKPTTQRLLLELSDEDKGLIAEFFDDCANQGNGVRLASNTKKNYISTLVYLSRYVKNVRNNGKYKPFREMSRDDFFSTGKPKGYLENHKREFVDDPDETWVNTYRVRSSKCLAFWKFLTQPDLRREERQTPPQLKGLKFPIRQGGRKHSVKQEDHWTPEEHLVFLKYCEDIRLACYHAIARETGMRPGELLQLKIDDLHFTINPSTGKRYAEFRLGRLGKMRQDTTTNIHDALPYYNTWIAVHPRRDNPHGAYLFPSLERPSQYRNKPLEEDSLRSVYKRTLHEYFKNKVLARSDLSVEDKETIMRLLKKPHFPYIRRHEFATEWASKLSDTAFNQIMGHSPGSRMRQTYVREAGIEGSRELLIAKGVITREDTLSPAQIKLQAKTCNFCHSANKHDARICVSCNAVISNEGYWEEKEETAKTKKELEELKEVQIKQEAKVRQQAIELAQINATFEKIEELRESARKKSEELETIQNHILKRLKWEEENPLTPLQRQRLNYSKKKSTNPNSVTVSTKKRRKRE